MDDYIEELLIEHEMEIDYIDALDSEFLEDNYADPGEIFDIGEIDNFINRH